MATLYPFTWQHTYIPVLPPSMIDIVCSPTPFLIGLLSSSLPRLKELPVEEVSSACTPWPYLRLLPVAELSSVPEGLLSEPALAAGSAREQSSHPLAAVSMG